MKKKVSKPWKLILPNRRRRVTFEELGLTEEPPVMYFRCVNCGAVRPFKIFASRVRCSICKEDNYERYIQKLDENGIKI